MAVVEIITFRLTAAADWHDAISADQQVQTEFIYRQPGSVRRTTARGDDGEWLVLQLWRTAADADAATEAAGRDLAAKRFQKLIDETTLHVGRYETLD